MPANYEPLIEGIARLIGISGKAVAKAAEKGVEKPFTRSTPGRAVTGIAPEIKVPTEPVSPAGRTTVDVEQWLGAELKTDPVKQMRVVHDYLRGAAALDEAANTGASHVKEVSVPVWQTAQKQLQAIVDSDPEVQGALRRLYIGRNTAPDPMVSSTIIPDRAKALETPPISDIVPENTPKFERRKGTPTEPTVETSKVRDQAWRDLANSVEGQNPDTVAQALEQIHALEPAYVKAIGESADVTPQWQKAIEYMSSVEQTAQKMQEALTPHEQWAPTLEALQKESGIDRTALPPRIRRTIERVEAWADAQKPATTGEMVGQVAGVPRALMSSGDVSAPGRQGVLMISRPEYWKALPDMIKQYRDPVFYEKHQLALRERESFPVMQEAGLAITGTEGGRLTPREEVFRSNLAEKIPVIGAIVRASERAYVGFLNDLRANVFDTQLQLFKEAGLLKGDGGADDAKLLKDLAEWINTSTGRGSTGKIDPGILTTVLFSPRLAISRAQTFNPQYYWKLNPAVRKAALQTNVSAAGIIVSLVSLAGLGGAKVLWDFRNPDAGKIRIGNTRIDIGGGHFQMLRFLTQVITAQKVNSETGKITKLGEGSAYDKSRFDLLVQFIVSKEAPVASLVTTWLKGEGYDGKSINWWNEVGSRMVPLAIQDAYEVVASLGAGGLVLAPLAFVGAGLQTYDYTPKITIPFLGVKGVVPQEQAAEFEKTMLAAEATGLANAMKLPGWGKKSIHEQEALTRKFVDLERQKARLIWIKANAQAYGEAKKAKLTAGGGDEFPLVAPTEESK